MSWMAKKKPELIVVTHEECEAEEEFLQLNPGASILACSPPGYHAAMKTKAAKAAVVGRPSKRKPSRPSRR